MIMPLQHHRLQPRRPKPSPPRRLKPGHGLQNLVLRIQTPGHNQHPYPRRPGAKPLHQARQTVLHHLGAVVCVEHAGARGGPLLEAARRRDQRDPREVQWGGCRGRASGVRERVDV